MKGKKHGSMKKGHSAMKRPPKTGKPKMVNRGKGLTNTGAV